MNLFGTDGIRGIANSDLSCEIAFELGRAVGRCLSHGRALCVGRDTRISGDMLEAALMAGITSVGRDVVRIGVITTPGLSYLIRKFGFGGGIMISASHNPPQYNGLKVFGADGKKISEEMEIELSHFITGKECNGIYPTGQGVGRILSGETYVDDYITFLCGIPKNDFSGLRVVVDTANGATSFIAQKVWERLGADARIIFSSPDGYNINLNCGSTYPQVLSDEMKTRVFEAGFAYDGDGDRCIACDEQGNILDGDYIMVTLALDMKAKGILAGDTVVGTVMANYGMELCLKQNRIKLIRTPVGDRFVLEEMDRLGCSLGGEQSGHIIRRDVLPAGDGILTSLMVADVLMGSGEKMSQLASVMTAIPQTMVNVKVERPDAIVKKKVIRDAVEKAEKDLAGTGRVLVRASGTEPYIRVMVESHDATKVTSCISYLEEVIVKVSRG